MNNLKEKIYEILNNIVPTYYERASKNAIYPYVVYTLEKRQKDYELEINLYDIAKSSTVIDEKLDEICELFDNYSFKNEHFCIETEVNSVNSFVEDATKRRRILVNIKYYK